MKSFFSYFKISFKSNTIYKVDFLFSIIGTCINIFIYCAIWKALYGNNMSVNTISYEMVTTNFILSLALSSVFATNDFAIQQKLWDGSISTDMVRPIDLRISIFARDLGEILFKLITHFTLSVIISVTFIGMLPPKNLQCLLLYIVGMILGFCVLWALSSIVQMSAFWIINVWSISTIKNVVVNVLSGIMIPIWFLPDPLKIILSYTPFESIYHIPVNIYLGRITGQEVFYAYFKQVLWFALLFILGNVMWNKGKKRIFVQGG